MRCAETDCPHEAGYVVKLCIPATGWPQEEAKALTMILGVQLCRRHAERFKPSQLLDAPTPNDPALKFRDVVPAAMARMAGSSIPPDCDRAWVVPLRLDSDEYRTFQRVSGGKPS